MIAKAECQKCKQKIGIEVNNTKEGFYGCTCPHCRHEQLVYVKMVTRKVPQVIGYAKDVTWCIQE